MLRFWGLYQKRVFPQWWTSVTCWATLITRTFLEWNILVWLSIWRLHSKTETTCTSSWICCRGGTWGTTSARTRNSLSTRQVNYFNEWKEFFIACILESLEYLHMNSIIHRDIKPENLVFDREGINIDIHLGYLRLTDLGIARIWRPDNSNDTSGTPGYMGINLWWFSTRGHVQIESWSGIRLLCSRGHCLGMHVG